MSRLTLAANNRGWLSWRRRVLGRGGGNHNFGGVSSAAARSSWGISTG